MGVLGDVTTAVAVASTKSFYSSFKLFRQVQEQWYDHISSWHILKQLPDLEMEKAMCEAPGHMEQDKPGTPLAKTNHLDSIVPVCTLCRAGFRSYAVDPALKNIPSVHVQSRCSLINLVLMCCLMLLSKKRGFQTVFNFIYRCKRILFIAEAAQLHSGGELYPFISLLFP